MLVEGTLIFSVLLFVTKVRAAGYSKNIGNDVDCNTQSSCQPAVDTCYGLKSFNVGEVAEQVLSLYKHRFNCDEDMFRCYSDELTEDQYVSRTLIFINQFKKTTKQTNTDYEEVLRLIYQSFNSKNKHMLVLFTAHALHNTSFFSVLEESGNDTWKSRGLLMIREYDNYKRLDNLVGLGLNIFCNSPQKLACLENPAISATVKFFEALPGAQNCFLSYEDSLSQLRPVEWTKLTSKPSQLTEEEIQRLKNRLSIYEELCKFFNK